MENGIVILLRMSNILVAVVTCVFILVRYNRCMGLRTTPQLGCEVRRQLSSDYAISIGYRNAMIMLSV